MISPRYAWAIAGLLLFALVPTVANVYRSPEPLPPGRLAALVPAEGSFEGRRDAKWAATHFHAPDFVSREYGSHELFVARTYDAKRLFHYPELALARGRSVTAERMIEIETGAGTIPVRALEFESSGNFRLALYALGYGQRPVRDPIPFMASVLPELFLGRREPMTLLYVQGDTVPGTERELEEDLTRLLAGTWTAFASGDDPD